MRAAVYRDYGGPIAIEEVPLPTSDGVLVRVKAAAVTSADSRIHHARFPAGFAPLARLAFGLRRPRQRVLGSVFAGVVERAAGPFAEGDAVCGMTGPRMGAHAERIAVSPDRLARVPAGVSMADAAGVLFGGTTALHFLRGRVASGHRVLVNGASGAVGTLAIQLAKRFGGHVTAVTSGANAELVRSLGADRVVEYTTHPVSALDERFDVVLDTVGNLSIASGRRLLADRGVLLLAVATLGETLRAWGSVKAGPAPERPADFTELLELVATGELRVVHDGAYELDDIADAHRRVDSGRKVGNVVVTL